MEDLLYNLCRHYCIFFVYSCKMNPLSLCFTHTHTHTHTLNDQHNVKCTTLFNILSKQWRWCCLFCFTVFVKESACDLYTWGGGGRGRLGHKDDDKELLPRVVESLLGRNITMVACGGAHTVTLSSKKIHTHTVLLYCSFFWFIILFRPCSLNISLFTFLFLWFSFPLSPQARVRCSHGALGLMADWVMATFVIAILHWWWMLHWGDWTLCR